MTNLASLKYLLYRDFVQDHIADIIDEIYIKKIYAPHLLGKKDLIIADLGANQGITVSYFAPYAKTLFAVEPAKAHLETLKKLVELNNLKQVKICPYAITNKTGKSVFNHNPNPTAYMLPVASIPYKGDTEEVETITIGDFFKREKIDHIDILKLDVEGQEGKIVASQEFAKYAPKINTILGEWHAWSGISKGLFMNTLRDLGYEFNWRKDTKADVFEAVRV